MNNNSEYWQALKVRPSLRSFRVIFQKSETQKSEKDGGTEVEIGNGYFGRSPVENLKSLLLQIFGGNSQYLTKTAC